MKFAKIILVEDNPMEAELAKRALRKIGLLDTLMVFDNGEELLAFLHKQPDQNNKTDVCLPALLLLDLKLPGMDGLTILEHIRKNSSTQYLPVIVFSSSSEENDIRNSYIKGANSYIRKPIDYTAFEEILQNVCIYWLNLNQDIVESKQ